MTDAPPPADPALSAAEPSRRSRLGARWLSSRAEVWWLFVLALAIRAAAAVTAPAILNDSADLLQSVEAIRESGLQEALHSSHHPLPLAVVAFLARWFAAEQAATWLGVACGALAVIPLHALARQVSGRHAAGAACLLYAALPKAIEVTSVPLAEGPFLPLALGALALALGAGLASTPRRCWLRLAASGLLGGLAYLCRPEGLVIAAAALAAAPLLARPSRRLRAALVLGVALLVVAAPYVVALSSAKGHLTLSPKKNVAAFVGVASPAAGAGHAQPGESSGLEDLGRGVRGLASGLERSLTWPLLLLIPLGAFPRRRWRRRRSIRPRAVVLFASAVLMALVIRLNVGWGYGGGRHTLTAALLLLPFAGEGLLLLGSLFARVTSQRRFVLFTALLLAMPLASRTLLKPRTAGGAPARRLGELLASRHLETSEPGKDRATLVIASFRDPLVAYYAGRKLAETGGSAEEVRLWRKFQELLTVSADRGALRSDLAGKLAERRVDWVVLDLFDTERQGSLEVRPGAELAKRLRQDGVLRGNCVAAGDELAAFSVMLR